MQAIRPNEASEHAFVNACNLINRELGRGHREISLGDFEVDYYLLDRLITEYQSAGWVVSKRTETGSAGNSYHVLCLREPRFVHAVVGGEQTLIPISN